MIKTFSSRAGRLSPKNKKFLSTESECLLSAGEKPITQNPIALDIGFGDAQSFSEDVAANETVTFIGIEPYKKGFARAVEFFEEAKPTNLYLFNGDAREFIELMDFSVNFIRIHFPDPWPKKRHTKRRLISKQFLKTLSRILCSDGLVQIVTDSKIYQIHIDEVLEHQQLFEATNSFPISYQVSTFHKKGLNKGHTIKEYNLKLITPCNQTSE